MRPIVRTFTVVASVVLALQLISVLVFSGWLMVTRHRWLNSEGEVSLSAVVAAVVSRLLPYTYWRQNIRETWDVGTDQRCVWGYVDRHSIEPGEQFQVMLSTGPKVGSKQGRLELFRVGWNQVEYREKVWTGPVIEVNEESVPGSAASIGPNWPIGARITSAASWRSGYYALDFVHLDDRRERDVAHLVVTNPSFSGDVLVKLSTNTYQAYNQWGGHSLYFAKFQAPKGQMVSFDRPLARNFRVTTGENNFYRWEYFLAVWLERLAYEKGFEVDYATDFDVHRDPRFTQRYDLLISVGHDEYWSKEEFDHVWERIFVLGKSTLFLGANIAYWQVRFVDVNAPNDSASRGRQMVCYKSVRDPIGDYLQGDPRPYLTARFRDGARRPETMLKGSGYVSAFDAQTETEPSYPFFVVDDSPPFFEGSGFRIGDRIDAIVGYEWDNRDPSEDGARLWDAERSLLPRIPEESVRVLFRGTAKDKRGAESTAEAVYFRSPAGADVFSAGTLRWSWYLSKEGFQNAGITKLTENLVLQALAREEGKRQTGG